MKSLVKSILLISLTTLTGCKDTVSLNDKQYSNWEVNGISADSISWTKFKWVNGNLGSTFYKRIAINIPCKIDGLENVVTFQFDTGADLTGVYENTFSSLYANSPQLKSKIKQLNSADKYYENLILNFKSFSVANKSAYVYKNFGNIVSISPNDTINNIGTIASDVFQNSVLLIDYKNERFAICSAIPADYSANLIDISLDEYDRVILPMKLADKSLKILFDTGSSLFPIITDANKINLFSTSQNVDVIQISSWGQLHNVTGKVINDTFMLAGQSFSNVKAYASTRNMGTGKNYDGITGNALFWDRAIAIDFKNKKFGVK